jgi:hypothetical protein
MTLPFWPFRKPKSKLELLQDSVQDVLSGTASGVHDTLDRLPLDRVSVPLSVVKEGAADTLAQASLTVAAALSSTAARAAEVAGSVAGGTVAKASIAGHALADAKQTLVEKAGAGLHGAAETASNVAQGTAKTASGAALSVAQTAGTVSGSAADTIQAKVQNMHQTSQERAAQLAEQARDTAEAARKATRKSAKSAGQTAASGGEATVEAAQATRNHAAELIAAAVAALSEATAQASKKARQRAEEARYAATEAAADAARSARNSARQGAKTARLKTEATADAAQNASQTLRDKLPARLLRQREEAQHEAEQAAAVAEETNKKLKKEKRRAEKKNRKVVVEERSVVRHAPEAVGYAPQVQIEDATSKWLWIALGALAGASLMLFLAPSNGRRSRALVKDKLKSAGGNAAKLRQEAARRAADLRNRAEGKLHEARSSNDEDFADDNTIADRVRTALGENELTRNLERLNVDCVDGIVTLRGPMVDEELKAQIETLVGGVKGVREVRSHLLLSDTPEDKETFVG